MTGRDVHFLKTYDRLGGGYDAVGYVVRVKEDGLEISGTWRMPVGWSGPFLMVRQNGKGVLMELEREERV